MPKPPKSITDLDHAKAGLQDDHDPNDIGQQQNDKPKSDFKPPKQPAGPYVPGRHDKVDEQGLPTDDSKFG